MPMSEAYYAKKREAEVWKGLRQDALDRGDFEASIAYGWTAIKVMNEALAISDIDLVRLGVVG